MGDTTVRIPDIAQSLLHLDYFLLSDQLIATAHSIDGLGGRNQILGMLLHTLYTISTY